MALLLFGSIFFIVVVALLFRSIAKSMPRDRDAFQRHAAHKGHSDLNQAMLTSTLMAQNSVPSVDSDNHAHRHGAGHHCHGHHGNSPARDHGHSHSHTHTDHFTGGDTSGHHSAPDTSSFDSGSHHH